MQGAAPIRLTKHHGAGNDFLVHLDAESRRALTADEVAALCHRRFGIGADGLLRGTPGTDGAALTMELRNADGGAAEMSGNGIRCLVQAAVDAGWAKPGRVPVDTEAGRRHVEYVPGTVPGIGHASVDMGPVDLGAELLLDEPAGLRSARPATVGNPHVVLLLDRPVGDAVVELVGARLERSVAGGANVEFVWPGAAPGELVLRVWERGVGETWACGTGTCAAAAAARSWGLPGTRSAEALYVVHNPGGTLEVELRPSGAVLGGPTVAVAEVRVEEATLRAMVAALGSAERAGPAGIDAVHGQTFGEVAARS